ncbi:MAG: phosphotransferase enzyme family protein [Planctomycetota bacterium]|jgi:Ser/Thr protein kinase RdoA (MazF antagonist)
MNGIAKRIEEVYGIRCRSVRPFPTGNAAVTCEVVMDQDRRVVKILPIGDRLRSVQLLRLQRFIGGRGISAPAPVRTASGELCATILYEGEERMMFMYRKLDGENAERHVDGLVRAGNFQELGREVARLHEAMQAFGKARLTGLKSWHRTDCLFSASDAGGADARIWKRYEDRRDALIETNGACADVIHGDLHLANVLFDGEADRFRFIDLEGVVLGSVQMDLATLIFDLPVVMRLVGSRRGAGAPVSDLIRGYRSIRRLSERQLRSIPGILNLLEASCYLKFRKLEGHGGPWIGEFLPGREERILKDLPYGSREVRDALLA